nr:reverse transcriptase domain-containing protein [Tanacetum cinerariifolium]
MRVPNVPSSSIKLMVFPFSLEGASRIWLEKEAPRSILTWEDLVSKFINQFFPPLKTTNLRNEITRFQQRFDESFYEACERFNDLLRACLHHGFSELHQLDTFYNALNVNDQDLLNSAAGGNFLDKIPRECLKIIESKSKVRQIRAKGVVAKVRTSSSTLAVSSEVSKLKDLVRALLLDKRNQSSAPTSSSTPAPVKAVEPNRVTSGAANYNQGNTGFRPQMVANQIRPPGFPPYQNNQNNFNHGNNFNQNHGGNFNQSNFNQGGNFNQGQLLQPQVNQPPAYQAPAYQAHIPQTQSVSKTNFESYVKANDTVLRNTKPGSESANPDGQLDEHAVQIRMDECLALADLGASINLMLLSVWEGLSLSELTSTCMTLELTDTTASGNPTPYDDPIISTTSPTLTPFGDNDFLLFEEADAFLAILNSEPLPSLPNHKQYIPSYKKELKVCEAKTVKSSIDEPLEVELKDLPPHLEYAFLESNNKLPVIIAKELGDEDKSDLIKVLKSHKRDIAWKLSDIQGINPKFCTHKILMEEDYKPAVQHQRRVNPKIHDVIKKEVEKLLDAGLIYPISDSPWVSPVHSVPKKGGFTVAENEENELIPTRLVTGWRVCIDYLKLNEATRKDHFRLPFMDQMLERLAGNEYYCFLDCFFGYFQIPIDPRDQEKTTFTFPYETFSYRRMPFGLCNAPGTFQRCLLAIFHDMVEKTMEVFMDEFSVFGNSFENCLSRLDKMLKRCEDTNLSLNW